MAVRNFYVHANIEGRTTPLRGGPRHKDGGLDLTLYQRHEGEILTALTIHCCPTADGGLKTVVTNSDGREIARFETWR